MRPIFIYVCCGAILLGLDGVPSLGQSTPVDARKVQAQAELNQLKQKRIDLEAQLKETERELGRLRDQTQREAEQKVKEIEAQIRTAQDQLKDAKSHIDEHTTRCDVIQLQRAGKPVPADDMRRHNEALNEARQAERAAYVEINRLQRERTFASMPPRPKAETDLNTAITRLKGEIAALGPRISSLQATIDAPTFKPIELPAKQQQPDRSVPEQDATPQWRPEPEPRRFRTAQPPGEPFDPGVQTQDVPQRQSGTDGSKRPMTTGGGASASLWDGLDTLSVSQAGPAGVGSGSSINSSGNTVTTQATAGEETDPATTSNVPLPAAFAKDPAVVRYDAQGQPVDADGFVVEYQSPQAREQAVQEVRANLRQQGPPKVSAAPAQERSDFDKQIAQWWRESQSKPDPSGWFMGKLDEVMQPIIKDADAREKAFEEPGPASPPANRSVMGKLWVQKWTDFAETPQGLSYKEQSFNLYVDGVAEPAGPAETRGPYSDKTRMAEVRARQTYAGRFVMTQNHFEGEAKAITSQFQASVFQISPDYVPMVEVRPSVTPGGH